MKKIFLIIMLSLTILLTGCDKFSEKTIKNNFLNNYKDLEGYYVTGDLEIYNGDNIYKYSVNTSYYDTNYKVDLINKNNNHEQIILRNDDGVYVLTPTLNKTFKFQSNWPENSSQIYIIESLLDDVSNDSELKINKKNEDYVIESKIMYSNNKNLIKEKIYIDKNYNIKKVEVFDEDNELQMKMKFNKIDKKATFNKKYFDVDENMKNDIDETKETMNTIEDIIYPMYLPSGTYLSKEETISKADGERVILSFAGESPFIIVQETASINDGTKEITSVSGDIEFIQDSIGAVSSSSVNFISNGIEYYLSSDNLTKQELIQVAESISPISVMK